MNTRLPAALSLAVGLSALSPARAADKTSAPAKTVVQISITDVDALEGKPLPPLVLPDSGAQKRDDLSAYEVAVCKADLPLVVTPRFSVTASEGMVGSTGDNTQIAYMPLDGNPNDAENALAFGALTNSLSATAHVNSDGTIGVDFRLTESKNSSSAWRELGPPVIVSTTVTARMTFRDGETRALLLSPPDIPNSHYVFLTVKLVSMKKG